MMKNHHKYFVNQRYKQKLENDYRNYSGHIYFITADRDPRYDREHRYKYGIVSSLDHKAHGKDYYIYWKEPEVDYSIHEYYPTWVNRKRFLKKYASRKSRRSSDTVNHCTYKRQFDLWWELD